MASAQVKNGFLSIGEVDPTIPPASLALKLAVNLQTVRYFVLSQTHNQVIFFGEYTLHHIETENELSLRIERIQEKDEILQLPFGKITIGIDGNYNVYPAGLGLNDGTFVTKKIEASGLELSCRIDSNIKHTLNSLFRNCEIVHINSALPVYYAEYLEQGQPKIFANIEQYRFDVLAFTKDGTLQIMNRYEFKNQNDFIYFLLLSTEKLNIDREKTELVLSGEVDIQSKVYDVCYRYFRFISFMRKPENINFSKAFDIYPKHLHFNLYNL